MADLTLTVLNAARQPIGVPYDLLIVGVRDLSTVVRATSVPGDVPFIVRGLPRTQPFMVQVYPQKHRPVGAPTPIMNADFDLTVAAPLHPDFAEPKFKPYGQLPKPLRDVLDASRLEGEPASMKGETLYDALGDEETAGLLNLYAKMAMTGLPDHQTAWDYVTDLYRIRPDRIFANVKVDFRDAVKAAEQINLFNAAPDNQHTPPPSYTRAGSFKSRDRAGNLQLTFFASAAAPINFKIDADIDDANGLGHVFQVLSHWLTGSDTHPYDIHEILEYDQRLELPYDLVAAP